MAKKKFTDDDFDFEQGMGGFDAAASADKLPVDIKGGKEPLADYMSLPVEMIDPFSRKDGSDFSRPTGQFYERLVDSVREAGVLEAVTVRGKPDGRYELLAGESRWTAAKDAGLQKIPAHIVQADDTKARKIYAWTNLLRRDLSMRDRINGWWHYHQAAKAAGQLNALREDAEDESLNEMAGPGERVSFRQIMRYVRMHDLIPAWQDLLEPNPDTGKPAVILRVGERIAGLPAPHQEELLPYARSIGETEARKLLDLSKGALRDEYGAPYEWTQENVLRIIKRESLSGDYEPVKVERAVIPPRLNRMRPHIMAVAHRSLRTEDYDRAPEIIQAALELYYSQHPAGRQF